MTNYIIIDDEYIAHDIIKGYCDMLPNLKLVKNCYDALEALEYLNQHPVDLIFLDLNMPKLKGFDFLKTLAAPPKVIVTTAYVEYALEGYELNVADYLLKPFSFERFLKAINKAAGNPPQPRIATVEKSSASPNTIFLRSNKKYIQVNIENILYLEAAGNYTKVIISSEMIMVRDKISELLTSLSQDEFIQVHKSFAVAKKHINSIEGNRIFIGEHTIPIGKLYKSNVNRLFS